MAGCLIDKGSRKSTVCGRGKLAGVRDVKIANKDDIDYDNIVIDPVNGITALPLLSGAMWYGFDGNKNTLSASEPLAKGSQNNTYYEPTVIIASDADENNDVEAFNDLGFSEVVAVCTWKTGKRRVYGLNNGLESTEGDLASGLAPGDDFGHTITLVGEEEARYPNIDPSVVLPTAN